MFTEEAMRVQDITRHVSAQYGAMAGLDQVKVMEILEDNRQGIIRELLKYNDVLLKQIDIQEFQSYTDNQELELESESYLQTYLSNYPKPYWIGESYFNKEGRIREYVIYIIRNLFQLEYKEMFYEQNKEVERNDLQAKELHPELKKKLETVFSAKTNDADANKGKIIGPNDANSGKIGEKNPFFMQWAYLDALWMNDFAEAKKGVCLLTDRDIHKLRDQIRRIINCILQVFLVTDSAMSEV